MLTSEVLAGLLGEESRRRVIAALILAGGSVDELAARAGVTTRQTVEALARLEQAELAIVGDDGTWVVLDEAFAQLARQRPVIDTTAEHDDQPESHQAVLASSIVEGRIVNWPTKRAKRVIVLEYLAQQFEPGRKYSEAEVNAMLRPFHDDVAMLRRWLYDEWFLDRAAGEYWRAGGRVDD